MYIFINTYAYKKKVSGSVRRENPDQAIIDACRSVQRAVAERKKARKGFVESVRNPLGAVLFQVAVSHSCRKSPRIELDYTEIDHNGTKRVRNLPILSLVTDITLLPLMPVCSKHSRALNFENFPSALGVMLVEAAEVECSFCGAMFVRELLLGAEKRCARCHIKLLEGCSCTQVSPYP